MNAHVSFGYTIHCEFNESVPAALNYDSLATIDDGSCLYPVYGCTDSLALNYNPLATNDDGTCNYTLQPMVDLFFSEYAEGSSNNKYFEIYNPSSFVANGL